MKTLKQQFSVLKKTDKRIKKLKDELEFLEQLQSFNQRQMKQGLQPLTQREYIDLSHEIE